MTSGSLTAYGLALLTSTPEAEVRAYWRDHDLRDGWPDDWVARGRANVARVAEIIGTDELPAVMAHLWNEAKSEETK